MLPHHASAEGVENQNSPNDSLVSRGELRLPPHTTFKFGAYPSGLLGCIGKMSTDFLGFLDRAGSLGDIVEFTPINIPGMPRNFLVTHPELVYQVVVKEGRSVWKGDDTNRVVAPALGKGLLLSEGEEHAAKKKLIQPGFTRSSLEEYGPTIVDVAVRATKRWIQKGEISLHHEMKKLTLDIVGRIFFGINLEEDDRMLKAMSNLDRVMQGRAKFPIPGIGIVPFIAGVLPLKFQEPGVFRRINDLLDDIVSARRESDEKTGIQRNDLLSKLLSDKAGLKNEEIKAELVTLFFAGHETTTTSLSFLVYELLRNEEAYSKVRAELSTVLGEDLPSMKTEGKLRFTEAVIRENLRMNPPVPVFARSPLKDLTLGDVSIPQGSNILVSPWVTHRSARFFKDPLSFRPERFLTDQDSEFKARVNQSYFPFGLGARACIGGPLAELELKLVLGTILNRLELSPSTPFVAEPIMRFTLDMRRPFVVRVRERN